MMRCAVVLALLCGWRLQAQAPDATASAGQPDDHTATITVRSSLVVVPALVHTKSGQMVYTLTANDFVLTDNGVPQKLRLDEDTGSQPLALVVCVEVGGEGAEHLADYRGMGAMLDNLIGSVEHRVAVVDFDSVPQVRQDFTRSLTGVEGVIGGLEEGDKQAAILDGLIFSVDLLRHQPTRYRRAILLLSETIDHGSHAKLVDALRAISDTNTTIYSVAFGSTRAEMKTEGGKFSSDEPGPQHGCFSRDFGVDADGNPIPPPESKGTQTFDCFAELAPPLRLAKMAEIAIKNALHRNTSESVAKLTGGEFYKFHDAKTLDKDLFTLSNHVPNRYTLSFAPQSPVPGFHSIQLKLPEHIDLKVDARNGYWVEGDAPQP